MIHSICICLICFKPNDIWITFLSSFVNYDIYIIIDDNDINYTEKYTQYKNIHIIQVLYKLCETHGYKNVNFAINKKISGWDKALFYFSKINTNYDYVWFMEDDVFFYNEQTLINIDNKYDKSDLLSNIYHENLGSKKDWLWNRITIMTPPPYYCAMVCCVRMSNMLLSKIQEYANTYKTLYFLEALFPTICKTHNLLYDVPNEFQQIVWRKEHNINDININSLYHPIKDINKHNNYRKGVKK